jgi:uridylate kinase
MKIALSLGGSLLTGKGDEVSIDYQTYLRYAEVVKQLHREGHRLIVVCGGGKPARYFIDVAKKLDASREIQDMLGVKCTHINALLFLAALGEYADQSRIYQRASELKYAPIDKILVGGGYRPGSSTDYRTAILAGKMKADLIINATDVDGVYTRNPKKYPKAEKIDELSYLKLEEIIKENTRQSPGEYGLFDQKGIKKAKKDEIPIIIIDGSDPDEIKRAVDGTHSGSIIR